VVVIAPRYITELNPEQPESGWIGEGLLD